jgi:hypothetical protein
LHQASKRVHVNGVEYNSINEAAIANEYDPSHLSKILLGKRKPNKKIRVAEYI